MRAKKTTITIPIRYRCPEHGLSDAVWKADSRMRAGGHFACAECARLNWRTSADVVANRERARKWYAKNRERKLEYEAKRRNEQKEARQWLKSRDDL